MKVEMGRTALEVRFDYDQAVVGRVKKVDGYEWNKSKNCWMFPVDIESYAGLQQEFDGELAVSEKVRKWATGELERRERIAAARSDPDPELQYEYASRLMPYQRTMVSFLVAARRALCSDQMGLGKTVEMIAALREMELQGLMNDDMPRYLIVCPNSMKHTWAREIRTWHPREDMPIHIIDKGSEGWDRPGWHIINWEKVARRMPTLTVDGWDAIVADESHRMKNPSAKQTMAMWKLDNSWNRFLLTGTPIRNHVPDLWAQLHWIDRRRFPSYWKFVHRFTITQDAFGAGGRVYKEFIGTKNEAALREVLTTIQMGRNIEDDPEIERAMGLPSLVGPRVIPVTLGPYQRKAYNQMRDEFVAILESEAPGGADEIIKSPSFMTHALRLKQLSGSLGIFSEEHKDSAKIDDMLERAYSAESEKHVVMTQFRTMTDELRLRLQADKVPYVVLTGQDTACWTPGEGYRPFPSRDDAVVAFNSDPTYRFFVATTQTGGEGITLVGARYFHFLDLMWTPAENDQAWHRVYRKGQTRTTFIFAYLALETIDFSGILPTLATKQAIIDAVFGRNSDVPMTTMDDGDQTDLGV